MTQPENIPLRDKLQVLAVLGLTAIAIAATFATPKLFPEIMSSVLCAEVFVALGLLVVTWGIGTRNYLRHGRVF